MQEEGRPPSLTGKDIQTAKAILTDPDITVKRNWRPD
jgi:hypothetical protein